MSQKRRGAAQAAPLSFSHSALIGIGWTNFVSTWQKMVVVSREYNMYLYEKQ